jgi:tRNA(Ile)-lysidine synthase
MPRSLNSKAPYPKPSAIGGTLIRKTISQFKNSNVGILLPIQKPVFISTSGGVDSMVLAHLIARYGRKIIDPTLITLLHFDHQWRKESGTVEKRAVSALAKKLNVKFKSIKLAKSGSKSSNAEEDARTLRRHEFDTLQTSTCPKKNPNLAALQNNPYFVFTAHHQNDRAETLLWRFLRGENKSGEEGVLFFDPPVLRPFLQVSKEEIKAYALQEKVAFHEDPTNQNSDQMRGFLRHRLIPLLKEKFPSFQKAIVEASDRAHGQAKIAETEASKKLQESALLIEEILGRKLARHHRTQLKTLKLGGELTLPGGTILRRTEEGFLIKIFDRVD